jgi:NitT/TauT family transport system substrate-binding protein
VIVRGDYLKKNAKTISQMIAAMREGWRAYLDDPKSANEVMSKLNPAMDLETFNAAADAQKPLIETDLTKKNGLGVMTSERWETLAKQLIDLKQLTKPVPASECFVNPAVGN